VRGVEKSVFRLTGRTKELERHEIEDACLWWLLRLTFHRKWYVVTSFGSIR
jgi:hypothetical protein